MVGNTYVLLVHPPSKQYKRKQANQQSTHYTLDNTIAIVPSPSCKCYGLKRTTKRLAQRNNYSSVRARVLSVFVQKTAVDTAQFKC